MKSTLIFITFLLKSSLAITLNCQFIDLEFCPSPCINHQCKAINLIITKPNTTITKIFSNNEEVERVKTLKIHDQVVHHMPTGLENFFPYLTSLQVWSCGLRSLSQHNIKVFEHLQELSVSGNEIEVLSSNLFEKNLKIVKIDFSRNRLKHAGFNLMKPLENLLYADFYHNDCVSDGSRNLKINLVRNLRQNCKPTSEMLIEDLASMNDEVDRLKIELKTCEKIHRSRRCNDESERFIGLDSLFPFIFVNDENLIE